jgi:tetratricopeptide (TPR) repeat protein
MNRAMSKSHRRLLFRFEGKACSRISVRGATHACHSGSAPRFARRSGYPVIFLTAILWSFVAASTFAQTDFDKANQEYAQGHFPEAISRYEALVRAGQCGANLFYDLGNAYFRVGDFGRAILNYERALALERHHPEAAANLQIARDEARALELQQSWPERYLQFASVNE